MVSVIKIRDVLIHDIYRRHVIHKDFTLENNRTYKKNCNQVKSKVTTIFFLKITT